MEKNKVGGHSLILKDGKQLNHWRGVEGDFSDFSRPLRKICGLEGRVYPNNDWDIWLDIYLLMVEEGVSNEWHSIEVKISCLDSTCSSTIC